MLISILGRKFAWITIVSALSVNGGCTSAVHSVPVQSNEAVDGFTYSIPATALDLTVEYRLVQCTPKPKIKVANLKLDTSLIINPTDSLTFRIDTARLSTLFSSVNPAKFTFSNGILTGVTFRPKSELRAISKQLTETLVAVAGIGAKFDAPPVTGDLSKISCNQTVSNVLDKLLPSLNSEIAGVNAELDRADMKLAEQPNKDNLILVSRLQEKLTELIAAKKAVSSATLTHSVTVRDVLSKGDIQDGKIVKEVVPDRALFAKWFGSQVISQESLDQHITIQLQVDNIIGAGANVSIPKTGGFDGIYYREPANARIILRHVLSDVAYAAEPVTILQFGAVRSLEIRNGAFQTRTADVQFEDDGQLKSYEMTSSSFAVEALGTVTDIRDTIQSSQEKVLDREITLLKKEKELLDAKKALREAREEERIQLE